MVALKPDLVIATDEGNREETSASSSGSRIPVYLVHANRIAETVDLIERVGELTGREAEVPRLTGEMLRRIEARAAGGGAVLAAARPLRAVAGPAHRAGRGRSMLTELIDVAGGDIDHRRATATRTRASAWRRPWPARPRSSSWPITPRAARRRGAPRRRSGRGSASCRPSARAALHSVDGDLLHRYGPAGARKGSSAGAPHPPGGVPVSAGRRLALALGVLGAGAAGGRRARALRGQRRPARRARWLAALPGGRGAPMDRGGGTLELRLPRVIAAALAGGALAVAGVAFQGLTRNPLAEPAVLGCRAARRSASCSRRSRASGVGGCEALGVTAFAFAGALLAAGAVYLIAVGPGGLPVQTLLLAGVIVGIFFTSADHRADLARRLRPAGRRGALAARQPGADPACLAGRVRARWPWPASG